MQNENNLPTYRDISKKIHMTPEGIRVVEKRALNKLIESIVQKYDCSYTEALQKMQILLDQPYEVFYEHLTDIIKQKLKKENECTQ